MMPTDRSTFFVPRLREGGNRDTKFRESRSANGRCRSDGGVTRVSGHSVGASSARTGLVRISGLPPLDRDKGHAITGIAEL